MVKWINDYIWPSFYAEGALLTKIWSIAYLMTYFSYKNVTESPIFIVRVENASLLQNIRWNTRIHKIDRESRMS